MNAITTFVIAVNLQSLTYSQEELRSTLVIPQYSPWKLSPLGQTGFKQDYFELEADGEHFFVKKPVNRIAIFVDGKRVGYAVRGTRVSPIPLSISTATRPSEIASENDRLLNCDYHLFGAGNIDFIIANETTNSDQPIAPSKE